MAFSVDKRRGVPAGCGDGDGGAVFAGLNIDFRAVEMKIRQGPAGRPENEESGSDRREQRGAPDREGPISS